jgi:O-antigen ligase
MIAPLRLAIAIVIFLAAVGVALRGGPRALRALAVLAIVLAPIRGGLLELGDDLSLGHPGLTVNALVPALVAALAIGVFVEKRPRLGDLPRPLLIGWGLIALAVLLSFPARAVGLKVYGVGIAQYLVYPTFALAIWPLLEPGDGRRLTRLIVGLGALVAVTVLLQAMGIGGFIQAASAQVDGLAANRYAGITGSYLHTSAFLGCATVLTLGELTGLESTAKRLGGTVLLAATMTGVVLTFSRSGVVISMIGIGLLFAFAVAGKRLRFTAMVVPAIAIAVAAGAIGGVSPGAAGERVGSGFNPTHDQGNKLRTESFGKGVDAFREGSIAQKAIGQGAAATGNAQEVVDEGGPKLTVESYYLKLLVETGVIGLLLVGGYLVWVAFLFARQAWRPPGPWAASVAAAGLGLSLYNAIYPALETQILALTWWLLLAVSLWSREGCEPIGRGTEQESVAAAEERSPALAR